MTGRVSFPMYDLLELRAEHEALWKAVAARVGVPTVLVQTGSVHEHWSHPDLLLTQTCGYPLVFEFARTLEVVATPSYRAPGAGAGTYSSAIVVREDAPFAELAELRGKVCAINDRSSHSGMNILRALVAPFGMPFFERVVVTGAHVASLAAIQRGEADVAAIDVVTHALLSRHRPSALAGTRILKMTPRAPALPYVTRIGGPVAALREALVDALAGGTYADSLLLEGVTILPRNAYDAIRGFAIDDPLA